MKMNLNELAKKLHADINWPFLNLPGPGHSKNDRSLGIILDPSAPDGFWVHSFADDPKDCRAYVKELLRKNTGHGSICPSLEDQAAPHKKATAHAGALGIWEEAQPIAGTLASTYLALRKCAPLAGHSWPSDLRFHPKCPLAGQKAPALVGLMRDTVTGKPTGIHRTALKDDGSGKREMPDGIPSKMMLGPAKSAAVCLHHGGLRLGLAEGIETALSAHQIFEVPVWSAMSAAGVRDFPVIREIKFLRIFADHDEAGLSAARVCKRRYKAAGIKVEIRHPPEPQSDWNDYHLRRI